MTAINWTEFRRTLLGDRTPNVLPPSIQLPMLPQAVLDFSRKAEDPNAGPLELGKIITTDSGLTCDLLKHVNSSVFGLKRKVSTAQQAITTLGIRASKLFLLTAGVQHAMKSRQSKLINFQSFWMTNLERSLAAKEIALLLKANQDVAFAASMLQDFLLPLLTNESYEAYVRHAELEETRRPRLVDYEQQQFGWNHAQATAHVLMDWSFPDDLVCCVYLHHGGLELLSHPQLGRTAVAAVALAALIPDPLTQSGASGLQQLLRLDAAWPEFQLAQLANRVDSQLREMSPLAEQHLSFKRRCEKAMAVAAV